MLAALLDVNPIAIPDIVGSLHPEIDEVHLPVFDSEVWRFDVSVEETQVVKLLNHI